MNIGNVKKRNILDFDAFLDKVHDETYEPLSTKNQSSEISPLSGLSSKKDRKLSIMQDMLIVYLQINLR